MRSRSKPILQASLLALLLLMVLAASAQAAQVRVAPAATEASVGQTVTISVVVDQVTDLGGFQFGFTFDPSLVEVAEVRIVSGFDTAVISQFTNTAGNGMVAAAALVAPQSGEAVPLAAIDFRIKAAGPAAIGLTNVVLGKIGGEELPSTAAGGTLNAASVLDTTPPVITLNGSATVTVEAGTSYIDAGATANDAVDGDLTGSIVATGTVNVFEPGTYTITYNVTDAAGNPATPVARTVNVVQTTFVITAAASSGGSITPFGTLNVNYGNNAAFTIAPYAGSRIIDVLVDGQSKGAVTSHTFEYVTMNHTISALFTAVTHTITATAGENGTISPSGELATEHGSNASFDIVPGAGYRVEDVLVDLVSAGSVTAYTFTNIDADHTITASFVSYTTPEFTLIFPVQDTVVNTDRVEYTLNKNMISASVTYTRNGGAFDEPRSYTFKASDLTAGPHNVRTGLPLVSGAIYTVTFTAFDGVNAVSAIANNVTYDAQAITISNARPAKKSIIKDAMVSYTLSEKAQTGKVSFTWTGGAADSGSPHVKNLIGAALDAGSHTLDTAFTLVNGAFYTVSFDAVDFAGNPAATVSNALVFFDGNYGKGPVGNLDGNDAVDDRDAQLLKNSMGGRPGDPGWNPACDLDKNNVIDQKDLLILMQHFGK